MEHEDHTAEAGSARPAFQEALQKESKAGLEYVVPFKIARLREEMVKAHTKLKSRALNSTSHDLSDVNGAEDRAASNERMYVPDGQPQEPRVAMQPRLSTNVGDDSESKAGDSNPATAGPSGERSGQNAVAIAGQDLLPVAQRTRDDPKSPQFLSSLTVWPYLFPAYGLLPLATGLQMEVKVPGWYQLIRAAVVVTAQVEDLRHAREGRRPSEKLSPRTGRQQDPWVVRWLRLQPTQRRRPTVPKPDMEPRDCLEYPSNTSAADWRAFWPNTRETVFTVMSELKDCSPHNNHSQAVVETMDPGCWTAWVVDVLWVFHQLLRVLPLEEDAIMTWVKRAQNLPETQATVAALASQSQGNLGRPTPSPSNGVVPTRDRLSPASCQRSSAAMSSLASSATAAAPQVLHDSVRMVQQPQLGGISQNIQQANECGERSRGQRGGPGLLLDDPIQVLGKRSREQPLGIPTSLSGGPAAKDQGFLDHVAQEIDHLLDRGNMSQKRRLDDSHESEVQSKRARLEGYDCMDVEDIEIFPLDATMLPIPVQGHPYGNGRMHDNDSF